MGRTGSAHSGRCVTTKGARAGNDRDSGRTRWCTRGDCGRPSTGPTAVSHGRNRGSECSASLLGGRQDQRCQVQGNALRTAVLQPFARPPPLRVATGEEIPRRLPALRDVRAPLRHDRHLGRRPRLSRWLAETLGSGRATLSPHAASSGERWRSRCPHSDRRPHRSSLRGSRKRACPAPPHRVSSVVRLRPPRRYPVAKLAEVPARTAFGPLNASHLALATSQYRGSCSSA